MNMDGLIFLDAVPTTFVNDADRIALEIGDHPPKDEQSGTEFVGREDVASGISPDEPLHDGFRKARV